MIRRASRALGNPYRVHEMPPEVTVGADVNGRPIVTVVGGHSRRAPGLSFADPSSVRALVADLNIVLAEWPHG